MVAGSEQHRDQPVVAAAAPTKRQARANAALGSIGTAICRRVASTPIGRRHQLCKRHFSLKSHASSVEISSYTNMPCERTIMQIASRESDVLSACLQYLILKGLYVWRQNQGAYSAKRGRLSAFCWPARRSRHPRHFTAARGRGWRGRNPFRQSPCGGSEASGRKTATRTSGVSARVNELGGVGVCVHSVHELEARLRPFLT